MNLPNQITLARLGLALIFAVNTSISWDFQAILALILFGIAAGTDWADGFLARRHGQVTNFGKLIDPLADKVLVTAALFYLVSFHYVPVWMASVMIGREFLITGLRIAAASNGINLAAEQIGKHKTLFQMVAITIAISYQALSEWNHLIKLDFWNSRWIQWLYGSIDWLFWCATVMTIVSGIVYFMKNYGVVFPVTPTSLIPVQKQETTHLSMKNFPPVLSIRKETGND